MPFTKFDPLVVYFSNFPLRTIKQDAFHKWCVIRDMIIRGEHRNLEGFTIIQQLAKGVNDKSPSSP